MSTELMRRGGIFTKLQLKGYLKDVTNNEITKINSKAIKSNNNLSYYQEKDKYTLKIISPTKLILKRITNEIESTLYFEQNKVIPSIYNILENDLSLEIDIKTNQIELDEKHLKITYTVVDSDTNYEYYIEMSEYK